MMGMSEFRSTSAISKRENTVMILENKPFAEKASLNDCPGKERLSLFVEQALSPAEMAETAVHVRSCCHCAETVKELTSWIAAGRAADADAVSAADRAAVSRILFKERLSLLALRWKTIAAAFVPEREILAAADGQSADQIQQEAAIRSGFMHFASDLPEGHRDGWRAKLAIPTAVTEETVLRILVEDSTGRPVESGTLTFCGVALDVRGGRVFMPLKTFRANLGKAMISLKCSGGKEVPGEPVLAGEMED